MQLVFFYDDTRKQFARQTDVNNYCHNSPEPNQTIQKNEPKMMTLATKCHPIMPLALVQVVCTCLFGFPLG